MYKRIVIKLGTSVLTGGGRQLNQARMVEVARQCAEVYQAGCDVVVCTSGAVAAGRAYLNHPKLPPTVVNKQLLAAVGQPQIMRMWERFFDIYRVRVGQILLTRADVENRQRYLNARDTFTALLEQRIVPVVNENDAVVTDEIRVGDNDNLSALVATLVSADLLILLTDQPGLFTADPRTDPARAAHPRGAQDRRDAHGAGRRQRHRAGDGRHGDEAAGGQHGPPRRRRRGHRGGQRAERDPPHCGRRDHRHTLPGAGHPAREPQGLDPRRAQAGRRVSSWTTAPRTPCATGDAACCRPASAASRATFSAGTPF